MALSETISKRKAIERLMRLRDRVRAYAEPSDAVERMIDTVNADVIDATPETCVQPFASPSERAELQAAARDGRPVASWVRPEVCAGSA
jgi:hypothetical protein